MKKTKKILLISIILVLIAFCFIIYFVSNNKNMFYDVYSIVNSDFLLYGNEDIEDIEYNGIKLLEYDNSNKNYAEIYFISYDYTTEPSIEYILKITDEFDNNLLLNGEEEQVVAGMVFPVKIKKVDLSSKINFEIIEREIEEKEVFNSAKIQIDLSNSLEEKNKIDQTEKIKEGVLSDIRFKYIDHEYLYYGTTSHAYSENLIGENFSIPINVQYGKKLINEENIEFSCEKNVNNLTLEEVFESLKLINENMGQYGLSDVYGIDLFDEEGNFEETVIIDFEEFINLCNGLEIEKNGQTYNKDSFEKFSEIELIKDNNVKIGNNINAIKYYINYYPEAIPEAEYYLFVYKDNIYTLKIPTNDRIKEEVLHLVNSLEMI